MWISPTSFGDPDVKWNNENQAYDGNTVTGADSPNDTARTWGGYIELNITTLSCDKIRFYAYYGDIQKISIDVYYSSDWHNIYEDTFANQTWEEKAIGSAEDVTAARVKFYAKKIDTAYLYELEFNDLAVQQYQQGIEGNLAFVGNTNKGRKHYIIVGTEKTVKGRQL